MWVQCAHITLRHVKTCHVFTSFKYYSTCSAEYTALQNNSRSFEVYSHPNCLNILKNVVLVTTTICAVIYRIGVQGYTN